jgi:hypothetical protein
LRGRAVRYVVAVAAFITTGSFCMLTGVLLGAYALRLGFPLGRVIIVSASMALAVVLPAYIVKKLLVDYW